jgi:DNA-binding NarL/FixJ family response regulator
MKFVLVEDVVMFRSFLRQLVIDHCAGEVVLEVGTLAELRANLALLGSVDLVLLDIRLPDGDGIDFIDEMSKAHVSTPVLLLSGSCEDFIVHRVSRSHVQGFVHKDENPDLLITAIQTVAAGGAAYSPRFIARKSQLDQNPEAFYKILSAREQQMLCYLGSGFSDAEAASALGLSVGTTQTHRRNVMAKLDLHSAQELQAYALKGGFTTIDRLQ